LRDVVDFISLAVSLGYDKERAIKAYRAINGGYFQEISYARPPLLLKLDKWPKKYTSPRLDAVLSSDVKLSELVSLYLTLDLLSIYQMSATLLNKPLNFDLVSKDFERTKEIMRGSFSNPIDLGEIKRVEEDRVLELGRELAEKRREELRLNVSELLNDLAYDSKTFEEAKASTPWLKGVKRKNALRAIALSGATERYLKEVELQLKYLAYELTLEFDNYLLSRGLLKTIESARNLESENAKRAFDDLVSMVKNAGDYF
jgi:hypothetical protein